MSQKTAYTQLNDAEERDKLLSWWESLESNRSDRARLRRAETPDDALLTEPFFQFLNRMPARWSEPEQIMASALVAAALAHVKKNKEDKQFAAQLASPKKGEDRPRMSELRFQQLRKSRTADEFFRRLLRAIGLLEGRVNVLSLADSILHWMYEYRFGAHREPQKRLSVRWATDYYVGFSKLKSYR